MLVPTIVVVAVLVVVALMLMKRQPADEKPVKQVKTQEQIDSEFIQRLCYLMNIVFEHSSADRRESSVREVHRIGEEIHEKGGFRYMVKIHETVTKMTSAKVGGRLKTIWKGVGDWRA